MGHKSMRIPGIASYILLLHTVDTKTVTPAQRQTVTAISTTNTCCTISKQESFDIKVHIVYKILALVLAIISLLDQQIKTFTFTASRSVGDSFRVRCVYFCSQIAGSAELRTNNNAKFYAFE